MNNATIQVRTAQKIKTASDTRIPRYNNTTIEAMQDIENAIKDGVRGTTDFNAVLAELNAEEKC